MLMLLLLLLLLLLRLLSFLVVDIRRCPLHFWREIGQDNRDVTRSLVDSAMAPKKVPKPADLIVLGQQQPAGDALAGRPAAPTTPPILASGAVAPPAAKRARHGEAPASASQPTPTPSALQDALVDPVVANLVDEVLATSSEERAAQVVLAALQTVQTAYGSSGAAATAVQQRVTFVFVGILAPVKKRPRLMRAASVRGVHNGAICTHRVTKTGGAGNGQRAKDGKGRARRGAGEQPAARGVRRGQGVARGVCRGLSRGSVSLVFV